MGVSVGQPTKGAVNIGDVVGVRREQPTKGAVNIGDIVDVSRGNHMSSDTRLFNRCIYITTTSIKLKKKTQKPPPESILYLSYKL